MKERIRSSDKIRKAFLQRQEPDYSDVETHKGGEESFLGGGGGAAMAHDDVHFI